MSPERWTSRLIGRCLAALALLWLAWQIVSTTAAELNTLERPEIALEWRPERGPALIALADRKAAADPAVLKTEEFAGSLRRALAADPLNPAALRLLALTAEARNQPARAETLMGLSSARSKRDLRTLAWLAEHNLKAGEPARAIGDFDALLRVWPNGREQAFPILGGLTANREGRDALISILARDPPWRAQFLAALPRAYEEPADIYALYSELIAGAPAPPAMSELRPYLDALIAKEEPKLAYALWLETVPPDRLATVGNLVNGDFDRPGDGSPFDWELGQITGARSEIVSDVSGGRVLRTEFFGARVAYQHVSQMLLLAPGKYRLSGRRRTQALQNERGLRWTVSCQDAGKELLAATQAMRGTLPWASFETTFEVPGEKDCAAQDLRLRLDARAPMELMISGEIWFDALRIERVAADEAG